MGVFRYENKNAAPTRKQRERYMKGDSEELHFGPEGKIVLILHVEAAYLKDEIDDVRILFTGIKDKQKVQEEVMRLVEYHQQEDNRAGSCTKGCQSYYRHRSIIHSQLHCVPHCT
jgi:hypothetical protein